jgi:hypothetical protein
MRIIIEYYKFLVNRVLTLLSKGKSLEERSLYYSPSLLLSLSLSVSLSLILILCNLSIKNSIHGLNISVFQCVPKRVKFACNSDRREYDLCF